MVDEMLRVVQACRLVEKTNMKQIIECIAQN